MIQITISGNTLEDLKKNIDELATTMLAGTTDVGEAIPDTWTPGGENDSVTEPKAPAKPKNEAKTETPQVTKTDLQSEIKVLLKAGKKSEVTALMKDQFKADKLSEVNSDDYPKFLAALKELE